MNIRNFLVVLAAIFLLSSCASMRRGSSSVNTTQPATKDAPARVEVKEPAVTQPAITVREERVRNIEHTGPDYRYYVIIGSFRVLDNARNFRADLIREQFSPVILENENNLYRVSVAAYNDEQAARDRIAQIRRQYEKYNDVWLLIRSR
jgi:cell division protein FtsN